MHTQYIVVIINLKSVRDGLVNDVLGVFISFRSSSIIIVLPSDPNETIISAGDPAGK